jgi:glutaminyl-tRNA synthetase
VDKNANTKSYNGARGIDKPASVDFIRAKVTRDLKAGKYSRPIMTRFPPEPNGFLHIGHAKSIVLNFGIAAEHEGGKCNLRFDDTNPITEEEKYAVAIREDVNWLGFDWEGRLYYASDYFEQFFEFAVKLVKDGRAYVDSLNEEEIREYRGTVTEPGRESPYRNRSVAENLDLLERMRAGEFPDGTHVLRAKVDMAAANMLMRDPLLYRIRHATHYRRGDAWCIYPMYDYAHCLEDAIEGVTHSLCTLEFKDNRALYDWVLENLGFEEPPEQTEFARLNLDYTVLSKRKLVRLVKEGHVQGWDDPRMPTVAGLRRRGVTPAAIRSFCEMIGVAKVDSRVDIGKLEYAIRDDLNRTVPRVMSVLRPLKVVLVNFPEDETEWLDAPLYPHDVPKEGSRKVPFTRELFIERDDFLEDPPKKFFRLAPGREVRLRYAYYIKCVEVIKDPATGEVAELHCTYDPDTKGGGAPDGRKVKGTLHWVSIPHAIRAEVRLYDRLFTVPDPDDVPDGGDFTDVLNPESVVTLTGAYVEPSVGEDPPGTRYQFERQGYFVSDSLDSSAQRLVFNRTVALRDTWAKISDRERAATGGRGARPESQAAMEPAGMPGGRNLDRTVAGEALELLVDQVLDAHPDEVRRYLSGKTNLLDFLVGQVMKESAGQADPATVGELIKIRLG